MPPDQATAPDLATPPDLATRPDLARGDGGMLAFCAGTTVAGTCLQAYFSPVANCWPATGACTTNAPSQGATNTCWQTGAQFFSTQSMAGAHGEWKAANGAITCMSADATVGGMGIPIFAFVSLTGEHLGMDFTTNKVTCPDGSTFTLPANFASDFGGCAALKNMLTVPMGSCSKGACP